MHLIQLLFIFGWTQYFVTEPMAIHTRYGHDIILFPKMRKAKELMKWKQFNSAIEKLLTILKMELKRYF
jgi:hypothetical protein